MLVYNPRHVVVQSISSMSCALQCINDDGPLDARELRKCLRSPKLVVDVGVMRYEFARVRLPGVNEEGGKPFRYPSRM